MNIHNAIGLVVARMRTLPTDPPYYLFGKRKYVDGILLEMDQSKVRKYTKYPMIALRFEIDEDVIDARQFNLNIVIATLSKVEYRIEERYERNIDPILEPLYQSFMKALRDSGLFMWPLTGNLNGWPPHTRTDQPYWGAGGLEDNEQNVFSDTIDAIEISELKINLINKTC